MCTKALTRPIAPAATHARAGKHQGHLTVLPGGNARLTLDWGAPYSGKGWDEFQVAGPDELHVVSHLDVAGQQHHTYTVVYRRKGSKQPARVQKEEEE